MVEKGAHTMVTETLKSLRRQAGLTQSALGGSLGVSQQAIAKWEAGRAVPEPEMLAKLSRHFDVTVDFLLGVSENPARALGFCAVPIIGSVKAGYHRYAQEEALGTAPAAVSDPKQYRYLQVQGDSMYPFIREGDLALVRLQPTLNNGELGVFLYQDGEATLKQYRYKNGSVFLVPFNEDYETLTISGQDLEQLTVFGKVVQTCSTW